MNHYTDSSSTNSGNRIGVEESRCVTGGSFLSMRGSFLHLTPTQTRALIADLQAS